MVLIGYTVHYTLIAKSFSNEKTTQYSMILVLFEYIYNFEFMFLIVFAKNLPKILTCSKFIACDYRMIF